MKQVICLQSNDQESRESKPESRLPHPFYCSQQLRQFTYSLYNLGIKTKQNGITDFVQKKPT